VEKHLHIICFSVPYPVDYGGAMDLFYKLPALQAQGIRIHLHCFDYGRGRQPVLERYCESVEYYERNLGHSGISNTLPYIVSSRKNEKLLQRLLQDDYPVLMEGIHCSYLLLDERFQTRKCFVRLHNVEYRYYHDLFRHSSSPLKKIYYWMESRLLKRYEKKICNKAQFLSVSENDRDLYREQLGCTTVEYLPLFIAGWPIQPPEGMGTYCLYHGDLGVEANEKAVTWLLRNVIRQLNVPFIIAGKNPPAKLLKLMPGFPSVRLISNPGEKEMQELIAQAQIHILPSYTTTGIKIKLLNVLFNGRHCVVNPATIEGSGLEAACHIATTANAFREIIAQLYHQPFAEEEIELRKRLLTGVFNNETGAKKITGLIP
jgi:glycosyltransferase involved in cell wall biosynthesis